MPPSRHSGSSHHSHSSSHHHSHSSHRSSSSYNSYSSSSSRIAKTRQVPRPPRARINQPANYTGSHPIRTHKCKRHDYVYYSQDWMDSETGASYYKGYYDEEGTLYDVLAQEKNGVLESQFDCSYCGTSIKQTWTEGAIPNCPNCGALLFDVFARIAKDEPDNSTISETYYVERNHRVTNLILYVTIVLSVITIAVGASIPILTSLHGTSSNDYIVEDNSNLELFGSSIYVESIGRAVIWNYEYQTYYDSVSDCYLWYNTDVEPNVWQYWYEDISSDFGDYGWMEYELYEDQWYIEIDDGDWIELPSKYETDSLWYITGDLAGTSYITDTEQ